jgi:hypothetical protein
MQRRADARGVVDLEKGHLIAFDERFDEEIAAIGRLALDGADDNRLDLGISGAQHILLPWVFDARDATSRWK